MTALQVELLDEFIEKERTRIASDLGGDDNGDDEFDTNRLPKLENIKNEVKE